MCLLLAGCYFVVWLFCRLIVLVCRFVNVLEYDAMEHLMAGTDRLSRMRIGQPKMGEYHENILLSGLYPEKYS